MELTAWQRIWMPLVLVCCLAAGGIGSYALGYQTEPKEKKPIENLGGYKELQILMDIRKELHYDELRAKVADLERRVKLLEESCDAGSPF